MNAWVETEAARIARGAERELEALVGISTPSGDTSGAEEAVAICAALLPAEADARRLPCSTEGYADDLLATVRGTGEGRLLLLGHVDTVVGHDTFRPLERVGDRLVGSGAVDMKGGVVISLGVLESLAARPEAFEEVALLLVTDEEWRVGRLHHSERFAGYDACLCFEAGQGGPNGEEGVVVKRKAAATLRVTAAGVSAHSGSAPDRGRNALLALAAAAQRVAELHDPGGPERLTVVPTIINSGEAFNVVPSGGELFCDMRAERASAFDAVREAVPDEIGGAKLEPEIVRLWPGMDAREATAGLLERASRQLGRPVFGVERGGASDASHMAGVVPVTVDGLGPRGGGAHNPGEYVLAKTLHSRAEVALALVAALLDVS
ncbi:MAG TPA: M20/M25/M40 family metallo-hydrolase [Thermoleophilaceae bacterium]|nr:M20/M25/M40 family metallo-hydrolase [Thermoleophilaceae bacterium]